MARETTGLLMLHMRIGASLPTTTGALHPSAHMATCATPPRRSARAFASSRTVLALERVSVGGTDGASDAGPESPFGPADDPAVAPFACEVAAGGAENGA